MLDIERLSPEREKELVVAHLDKLRQSFQKALETGPRTAKLEERLLLADVAHKAASELKPGVLSEIWGFHVQMARHNGAAVAGMERAYGDLGQRDIMDGIALSAVTKNFVDHIGRDKVDENLMPWQYRK